MSNSLRSKISKLRHDRHITEAEYQEIIKKLDGHDKQIRADYLNELIDVLNDSFPMTPSIDIVYGYHCAIERLEQLKEQANGKVDSTN